MTTKFDIDNDIRVEMVRKLINLGSIVVPLVYFFISKTFAVKILTLVTIVFLIVDITRHHNKVVSRHFDKLFGFVLRKHERGKRAVDLNGATWFLIAATVCVAFCPKYITVIGLSMFSFADIASALIGRRFGRVRLRGNRTLEGSLGFVVVAILVILSTPKIEYALGEYFIWTFAAVVGACTEVLSFGIADDNIAIPISICVTTWLLYALIYPAMNIYEWGYY